MLDTANVVRTGFRTLNHLIAPLVERGVGNPPLLGFGPVMVQTRGRKSGLARRVPLLSARIGNTVIVSTVRPGSQWMANLQAAPSATVTLFGSERRADTEFTSIGPLRVAALRLRNG